jgi:hypothetical protein
VCFNFSKKKLHGARAPFVHAHCVLYMLIRGLSFIFFLCLSYPSHLRVALLTLAPFPFLSASAAYRSRDGRGGWAISVQSRSSIEFRARTQFVYMGVGVMPVSPSQSRSLASGDAGRPASFSARSPRWRVEERLRYGGDFLSKLNGALDHGVSSRYVRPGGSGRGVALGSGAPRS